ncbi:MAG: tRNA-dihydrouridine synthase, partial [Pseudomonadota bacterium]
LVNGDIRDFDDLATALAQSGADGVMVGRGAYGAPWQPGRLAATWRHGTDPGQPTAAQIADIAVQHVEMMLQHYGTALGLRNARKHIGWYLAQLTKDPQHTKQWRQRLCTEENANRLLRSLAEFRHLETTA